MVMEMHLDHDIRALVNVRHDRYVFLWLMRLTIGEEREMGSCEKERADFKQQKADHRFCLPNSEIAARSFFLPTVMLALTRVRVNSVAPGFVRPLAT